MKKSIYRILSLLIALLFVFLSSCSKEEKATETAKITENATTAEETLEEETKAPEKEVNTVSFLATGDNLIHSSIFNCAADLAKKDANETRKHNFVPIYDNIRSMVEKADLAMINQETPLGGDDFGFTGYPRFNSPQSLADDLKTVGFDIVTFSNNHMLDKGETGLKNTVKKLNDAGLVNAGAYLNEEDLNNIRVVEKNGVKIAIVAFTYGTNGLKLPAKSECIVPYVYESGVVRDNFIKDQLSRARAVADFVVVAVHWGTENTFKVYQSQMDAAKTFADNGADIIIGTHPHVIQKMEWIENKDGRKILCAYSLGNLISTMYYGYDHLGGILTFDITNEGSDTYYAKNVLFHPTVFYFNNSYRNMAIYKLPDFTESLAKSHRRSWDCDNGEPVSFAGMKGYYTKNISEEFWPDYVKEYLG